MKKPNRLLFVVSIILAIAVLNKIGESEALPDPRRGGGRSNGKSSGRSETGSWFGTSKKKNKGYSYSGGKCE